MTSEPRRALSTASTATDLAAIHAESDPNRREHLIGAFLASRRPLCAAIARREASRRPGVQWERDGDDLTAMSVAHSLVLTFIAIDDPGELPWRWEAALTTRALSAIRDWCESSALTGVSGMTGAMRRRRTLATSWDRLVTEKQRIPTQDELLAAQHQEVAGRANPTKQGAVATAADIAEIDQAFVTHQMAADIAELQDPFAGVEMDDTIQSIVTQCRETGDDTLGSFADVWLRRTIDGGTLADVAREMGLRPTTARKLMVRVREVAAPILAGQQ